MSTQDRVRDYLKQHPGVAIHGAEIDRALGLKAGQATGALCRLTERYPRCGVKRVKVGVYRYADPFPDNGKPVDLPAPTVAPSIGPPDPGPPDIADDDSPDSAPIGALFEAVTEDKHGFSIVQAEDGTREFVLVRRTLLNTLLEQAKDRAQVEAFKKSLRLLTRAPGES